MDKREAKIRALHLSAMIIELNVDNNGNSYGEKVVEQMEIITKGLRRRFIILEKNRKKKRPLKIAKTKDTEKLNQGES